MNNKNERTSIRSLFHLQHKDDSFGGDGEDNPYCFKWIYEDRNHRNRCVCDDCFEEVQENKESNMQSKSSCQCGKTPCDDWCIVEASE